jgi:hypothetical protein
MSFVEKLGTGIDIRAIEACNARTLQGDEKSLQGLMFKLFRPTHSSEHPADRIEMPRHFKQPPLRVSREMNLFIY